MRQHPARALAGLGVVFQQSALDLDLTVMANLLFHTDLHGIPRKTARERIDAQLAAIGLQDQAKAVVRSLSGGTRRKVELVRALLHRPRLLLMDEATVGLDPASRQQLLDTVRGLCRDQGLAVLWATHLIEEVKDRRPAAAAAPGHGALRRRHRRLHGRRRRPGLPDRGIEGAAEAGALNPGRVQNA